MWPPCDEGPPAMWGHFCLDVEGSVQDVDYCVALQEKVWSKLKPCKNETQDGALAHDVESQADNSFAFSELLLTLDMAIFDPPPHPLTALATLKD